METIEINEIAKIWTNQDRLVTNEVLTNLEYLSIGINNLITSFDPDEIFINSPLVDKIPELLTFIRDNLRSHLTKETKLSISCLTDKATVYGEIALPLLCNLYIPD